ncbi:hypothetical protein L195_g013404, partial [Trifolium pratense]
KRSAIGRSAIQSEEKCNAIRREVSCNKKRSAIGEKCNREKCNQKKSAIREKCNAIRREVQQGDKCNAIRRTNRKK